MTSDEVHQALLDAIGKAAPQIAGTGQGSGEALRHLAEAWAILNKSAQNADIRAQMRGGR